MADGARYSDSAANQLQTTDATTTTLCTVTVPDVEGVVEVTAWATGQRDTSGKMYKQRLTTTLQVQSSSLNEPVSAVTLATQDQGTSGYTIAIVPNTLDIDLDVTGAGGENVRWQGEIEYHMVEQAISGA